MTEPEHCVYFLRLNSGEDIISEVIDDGTDIVTLVTPFKILYTANVKPGYLSISLMQWVFTKITDDQQFKMPRSAILLQALPTDGLDDYYWQTVEYFAERAKEHNEKTEYERAALSPDEEFDPESNKEALEMLEKLLSGFNKPDKNKLN